MQAKDVQAIKNILDTSFMEPGGGFHTKIPSVYFFKGMPIDLSVTTWSFHDLPIAVQWSVYPCLFSSRVNKVSSNKERRNHCT